MEIKSVRPGAFRFCPACGSRNKVQRESCAACSTALAGAASVPTATFSHFSRPGPQVRRSGALRWIAAAGVLLAVGAVFLVRGLLGSPALEAAMKPAATEASAIAHAEPGPDPAAALPYTPGWNPGALRAEPSVPAAPEYAGSGIEVLPPPPPALGEALPDSGMGSFTPRPVKRRPLAGRAFTNDDL